VRRSAASLAVVDHNAPTTGVGGIADPKSRLQNETLERNARQFGVPCFSIGDRRQGISHVVGPEQLVNLLPSSAGEVSPSKAFGRLRPKCRHGDGGVMSHGLRCPL
jgi:hypothetical protein